MQPGPGIYLHNQRPELFVDYQVHTEVTKPRRLAASGGCVENLFSIRHLNFRQGVPGIRVCEDLFSFKQGPRHLARVHVYGRAHSTLVEVGLPFGGVRGQATT